ncbi:hypothetical protein ABZP36_009243 [Zizania latifolia]
MVDNQECSPALEPVPMLDSAPPNPDPSSISPDAWDPFETAAGTVVGRIQPNAPSENRRAAVIAYVQGLIRCTVGGEVFPFGSVPLKTYLPDGDIDLTAFGYSSDEILAKEVQAVLESEERRKDAEFEVKDVQYIHAEVKLVKCIVQNIIVDISFNQFGGLCTLSFLEQVDQNFGKKHLFKRSIMLIKAWCYYESRILGAHHGLISTYALEILVLYIFHLFHGTLDGPLAVLYRFLDYYSRFDWDNKGISLYGPVSLSSLPELVTDPPDTVDEGFIKREDFLKECAQWFTVPPRNSDKNSRVFSRKFFNIVDPLKQSNNLGRSVSKGNFLRIRSAFDFGARKLGKILQVPANSTVDEVNQFFRNTLKRHCTRVRPDVQEIALDFDVERADNDCSPLHSSNPFGDLSDQFNNISISDSSNHGHGSLKQKGWNYLAKQNERKSVSGGWPASKATNPVISNLTGTRNGSDSCEPAPISTTGACTLPSEERRDAPDLFFNESENGRKAGIKYDTNMSPHGISTIGYTSRPDQSFEEVDDDDGGSTNSKLSDLTGDYLTNLNNLLCAQGFHQEYPVNHYYPVGPVYYQMLSPPPARYQNRRSSNGHSRNNVYGYAGANGIGPGPCPPGYFVMRPYSQIDDPMRARGTGTYFPDPNLCRDRSPTGRGGRGKSHFLPHNYQRSHYYDRAEMSADLTPSEELRQEPPMQIYVPSANGLGIPSSSKIPISSPSSEAPREVTHDNGFVQPQDKKLEFGTLVALPFEVTSQDQAIANKLNSTSSSQRSAPASTIPLADNPGMGSNHMRNAQSYHLKDSGDFPPLSS